MAGRADGGLHVVVDAARNSLRLMLPATGPGDVTATPEPRSVVACEAVLDVGEAGRLLGLEIMPGDRDEPGRWYLELEDAPGDQFRSVPVVVSVAWASEDLPLWVDLPRRGDGYELTFPIGNQCWVRPRRAD